MKIKFLLLFILMISYSLLEPQNVIKVYTTEKIRELNPFLCQSQAELMLQEIVFPPLKANFRMGNDSQFKELIIGPGACEKSKINEREILIPKTDLRINSNSLKKNFEAIRQLKGKSLFSGNPGTVIEEANYFKIQFEKGAEARDQGCNIPMVNFDKVQWAEGEFSTNIYDKSFQDKDSSKYLKGFPLYGEKFGYLYKEIELNNERVRLTSDKSGSPEIEVTIIPIYKDFINQLLKKDTVGLVGINISPISTDMGGLKFYEQGLSQNYIKVMRFLRNGLLRDGKSTGINHQHIQYIRSRIWKSFGQNRLFGKINSVYKVAGFSEIKLADEPLPDFFEGQYNSLTLRYVKDDLNDEMIKIMSEIFDELGIKLNPQETPKIDPDDKTADIVIENIYVFEPSFFNIKYYEEWYNYYNDKGSNIWGGGILYKEIKDSIQSENLKDYEYKMLNTLPVIFLYKYPAQIGYKNIVPNRSRKVLEQEIKGTPFFFYNVINWRLCND